MATETARQKHEQGEICFFGTPVFTVDVWPADGLWYAQPHGLDLLAYAEARDDLPSKLGEMVEDLLVFLAEEVKEPTAAELETLELIVSRLGPALAKYHASQRRAALRERFRAVFSPHIGWKLGPASTHHESAPVLTV